MSTPEPLFLDPGHDDVEAALVSLSKALDLECSRGEDSHMLGSEKLSDEIGGVGGRFEVNDWQGWLGLDEHEIAESDIAVFDDLPLVWVLRTDASSLEEQQRRARGVFDLVVERLGWSAVLTHNFEMLVATYDPERGVREFAPGTPADGTGRHIWG